MGELKNLGRKGHVLIHFYHFVVFDSFGPKPLLSFFNVFTIVILVRTGTIRIGPNTGPGGQKPIWTQLSLSPSLSHFLSLYLLSYLFNCR